MTKSNLEDKFRLLLVEDDSDSAKAMRMMLKKRGVEVSCVPGTEEAMESFAPESFDAVVTDIRLAGMSGVELLRWIRQSWPDFPVILLTGYDSIETAVEAVRLGADDYILKPLDVIEDLLVPVRKAVRSYRALRENRALEENLRKSHEDLKAAFAELKGAQNRMIEQERMLALGRLTAGIAHDFRNALMPIYGTAGLLLNHPETLDDRNETIRALQNIKLAAEHAMQTINRLKEFYHPSRRLEPDEVKLNDLIAEVIVLTEPVWKAEAASRGNEIRFETHVALMPAMAANAPGLRNLLVNLTLNALDAMPNGGVIRFDARMDGTWAVIKVSDTGHGMSKETLKRCSEPFFSTWDKTGAGIGLEIADGIAAQHGGTMLIENEHGKGTTVTIRLPFRTLPPGEKKAGKTPAGLDKKLRVLVIDDQALVRAVLVSYLKHHGHSVQGAADGATALARFHKGQYDLVLTDRAMPGMRGEDVAQRVKEMDSNVPVIMVTGFHDMMGDKHQCPRGIDAVLSKPLQEQELMDAIARVVNAGNAGRQARE